MRPKASKFNLEKLKSQTKVKKFWEYPSTTGNGSRKKPRYYKRQLYRVKKELM